MSTLPQPYFSTDDLYSLQPINLHTVSQSESQHLLATPVHNSIFVEISPDHQRLWYEIENCEQYRVSFCGFSFPHIRQFKLYHFFQLFTHCFVLFTALITGILGLIDFNASPLSRSITFTFTLAMILIDLFLAYQHYHLLKYSPYSLASSLLYFKKGLILIPQSPSTIFFLDKLGLLCQGYLFVIIPYINILKMVYLPQTSTQLQHFDTISSYLLTQSWSQHLQLIFGYVVLVQLCLTLYAWITFCLFYTVFVYEIVLRTFCCCICCFRPRKYVKTTDYPILQEHVIDYDHDPRNLVTSALQAKEVQSTQQPRKDIRVIQSLPGVFHSYYHYMRQQLHYDSLNSTFYRYVPKLFRVQAPFQSSQQISSQSKSQLNDNSDLHDNTTSNNQNSPIIPTPSHPRSTPQQAQQHRKYDTFHDNDDVSSILNNSTDQQGDILMPSFALDQQEFIPTVPHRDHLFVSHVSDPVFYIPYQLLWQYM